MIHKGFNAGFCLLAATLGNTMGGVTSYALGYLGKWEWLEKYFGIKKEKVADKKKYADQYGGILAFLTWLPIIGDPLAVALGFFRVPFISVVLWMTLGKFLRYLIVYLLLIEFI